MSFGAEIGPDGGTRFRLWAPGAGRVELCLEASAPPVAMSRDAQGWASATVAGVPAGTTYRFRIDGRLLVPDPASRFQPQDVHGPSEVIDPAAYGWSDAAWAGVSPERLVYYELHVGTFTAEGTFAAAAARLDDLAALGVTAVELMPLADFPGRRGWGYDGVLPFAPDSAYGRPEELKALVDAAHARGIAVLLDVVYNHLGPEGNYLGQYAPEFFSRTHHTPWGAALNFDGPGSPVVRQFIVDNALYWLEEFHLDGLRLDAVHAIVDSSPRHIVDELAGAVAAGPARHRAVHLVLENAANEARWLAPRSPAGAGLHRAQWNDDVHHALHVLLTGERGGYYADYQPPVPVLGRCLTEGFAFQGEWSAYGGGGRGEPSRHLPPTAFVAFLQNHDQIGNRALGERVTTLADPAAVRAATAALLLSPAPPLLFMGQEWGASEPFLFFSDLGPDVGPLVAEGRRAEFARFPEFADPESRLRIPDPQDPETCRRSVLDWSRRCEAEHRAWVELHRALLEVRAREIAPLLAAETPPAARWQALGATALDVEWRFARGGTLRMVLNLGPAPVAHAGPEPAWGRRIHALGLPHGGWSALPPWSVGCYLRDDAR
ncbi:MAG TPA: malto-oligosyltrehalose trehalohydrolase [Candidatus Binatia bacterium]|nr:malto-oligosyltrehalose trehalohydrolase [Candidatus Binatia bacterium]